MKVKERKIYTSIAVLGNKMVGKSRLIKRIIGDRNDENYNSTFGMKHYGFEKYCINFWEFSGDELEDKLVTTLKYIFKSFNLFFLICSADDDMSLEDLVKWNDYLNSSEDFRNTPRIMILNYELNDYRTNIKIANFTSLAEKLNNSYYLIEYKSPLDEFILEILNCIKIKYEFKFNSRCSIGMQSNKENWDISNVNESTKINSLEKDNLNLKCSQNHKNKQEIKIRKESLNKSKIPRVLPSNSESIQTNINDNGCCKVCTCLIF